MKPVIFLGDALRRVRELPDDARRTVGHDHRGAMTMERQTFDNVFEALMDTPEEAANMTLRSDLMRAIRREVQAWGLAQTAAAARLGVSQPRLNDLLRNRINKFSLEALVTLAFKAGLTVHLDVGAPAAA